MPSQGSQSVLPPARDEPHLQGTPTLVPAQEQSEAGLFSDCQHKSRKDAWQQAQACSLGGRLQSLLSSVSCNRLRGPRQASPIPPCHWPSFPAKHHPTADSSKLSAVTLTPLPQGKPRNEMSPLSFWRGGAIPRSRLECDRHTGPWAWSKQSPARALAKGSSPLPAYGWRILHCPPVAIQGGAVGPKTAASLGVPSPAASRAQETAREVPGEPFTPCQAIAGCHSNSHMLSDHSPVPLSPDIPLPCPVRNP